MLTPHDTALATARMAYAGRMNALVAAVEAHRGQPTSAALDSAYRAASEAYAALQSARGGL